MKVDLNDLNRLNCLIQQDRIQPADGLSEEFYREWTQFYLDATDPERSYSRTLWIEVDKPEPPLGSVVEAAPSDDIPF